MMTATDDLDIDLQGDWFRSVFDCLNDAVFIHDVITGAILEVNQRACEMYGCDPDEMRRLSMAACAPAMARKYRSFVRTTSTFAPHRASVPRSW